MTMKIPFLFRKFFFFFLKTDKKINLTTPFFPFPFYFLFFIFIFNIKTDSSSQKGKAKLLSFDLGDAESQVHTDKEDVSDNWDEEELQLAFRASKQVFFFSFFFFFSS